MAILKKNKKKKYLGIITSFTNLKNGLLQIHEQLVNELSKNISPPTVGTPTQLP